MAIQVPKANRQVEIDTPRYQNAPDIPHTDLSPNMRSLNVIGQANQEIADTGVKIAGVISKHMQERVKQQQEAEVSAREVSYRTEIQDLLYSKEPVKIKSGDQEIEAPAGYMNRQLDQAQGSTIELESKYKDIKNKYLSGLRTREQYDSLSKSMDSTFLSARGMVINNEGDQFRKSMITKHEINAAQQISSGTLIGNSETLNNAIVNLNDTYAKIGAIAGQDEETVSYVQKDKAGDLVANSVNSFLLNTANLKGAKELLDSVKDKINPSEYTKLSSGLTSGFKRMKEVANAQIKEEKVLNRYNYLEGVLNGEIDWKNSNKVIKDIGGKDELLARAVGKIVTYGGQYPPSSMDELSYMNTAKIMLSMNDKEEVSDFLLKTLDSENRRISVNKLSILLSVAKQRHEELNMPTEQKSNNVVKSAIDFFEKSNVRLAPAMFVNFMNSILDPKYKNKNVEQLKQEAARKAIVQQHPEVGGLPVIPNKISNPNNSVNSIYNSMIPMQGYDDGDYSDQSGE